MKQKKLIFIGADHAGYALKETLRDFLEKQGYLIRDSSPTFSAKDDYPIYAKAVARGIQKNKNTLGVLICGTGHGMEITANRFRGIRAIVARNE